MSDTLSQNYRMRSLLQRVCTSLREYDSVQANLSVILGVPFSKIPHDVLDAFLHDSSAITGKTRRAHGWRAVEDIHHHVQRQQEILQAYQRSLLDGGSITPPHKAFEDPVVSLMQALDTLAAQRALLARKAKDVSTVLKRIKEIQADVKREYNDALAHTSLMYPEVRQGLFNLYVAIAECPLSFRKSPLWKKTLETDINNFGTLVLTPSRFSLIPSRPSGATTAKSSAKTSKTSSSYLCTVTNSPASPSDTPSDGSRAARFVTGLVWPSFLFSVSRSPFFRCAPPGL